ncbi:hypothetical protein TNCV_4960171 [Trichonephila clavipes]|uniref:Uncharacterized protein n=1 Tax=Trichonephila clavipes TaxID=2585209 RepID=A0A8X6SR17_TRICX|nr:hypothetical protein TNCV_4960171 [Trichonephila clavipes]
MSSKEFPPPTWFLEAQITMDPTPANNSNNKSERQSSLQVTPSHELNSSDFQDIIALFKIISNIFKQFPKLKQILPDLKTVLRRIRDGVRVQRKNLPSSIFPNVQ